MYIYICMYVCNACMYVYIYMDLCSRKLRIKVYGSYQHEFQLTCIAWNFEDMQSDGYLGTCLSSMVSW